MWKMILGQAIYQLAVVFTLHYAANNFFPTDTAIQERQLQTFVFNTYMFMQLFNQTKFVRLLSPWSFLLSLLTSEQLPPS